MACWGVRRNSKPPIEPCAIFVLFFFSSFQLFRVWTFGRQFQKLVFSFLLFYKRKRVFSLIILSSLKNKLTAFLNDGQSKVQGLIKFCFFFGEIFQCRPCFSRCFLVCVCVWPTEQIYISGSLGLGKQMVVCESITQRKAVENKWRVNSRRMEEEEKGQFMKEKSPGERSATVEARRRSSRRKTSKQNLVFPTQNGCLRL